ncbi:MAG: hypothetical protein U0236_07565 [Nitrospira sp.]
MNINLHIERLVLDGLDLTPEQRPILQAAVETELTRLLASGGVRESLRRGGAFSRANTADLQLRNDRSPTRLGEQIAEAVYGGIGHEA